MNTVSSEPRTQPLCELVAVDLRPTDIEHGDIRCELVDELERASLATRAPIAEPLE